MNMDTKGVHKRRCLFVLCRANAYEEGAYEGIYVLYSKNVSEKGAYEGIYVLYSKNVSEKGAYEGIFVLCSKNVSEKGAYEGILCSAVKMCQKRVHMRGDLSSAKQMHLKRVYMRGYLCWAHYIFIRRGCIMRGTFHSEKGRIDGDAFTIYDNGRRLYCKEIFFLLVRSFVFLLPYVSSIKYCGCVNLINSLFTTPIKASHTLSSSKG